MTKRIIVLKFGDSVLTSEASARRTIPCAVRSEKLPADHFLAGARAEENRIEIELRDGGAIRIAGEGTRRYSTTEAVMADLFDMFRLLAPPRAAAGGTLP